LKRLILCCDGTWNRADQRQNGVPCPTNVIHLAFRVAKRDGAVDQVLFYDQGVGTGNFLDRLTGGAFGDGLVDNIFDAYRFLIANYEPGDAIYVFGFSRGAYTARSLCGMIRKCGILKRASILHYHEALTLYRRADCGPNDPESVGFRRKHSVVGEENIEIQFLGVWDTVGALGIPLRGLRWLSRRDDQFHDTELSGCVRNAYHALAIDEHRGSFEPTLWMYKPKPNQTVRQVWFAGAHSDVGGGYPETGLSHIALRWMIEGARTAGLAFDPEVMGDYPLKLDASAAVHDSMKGFFRLTPGLDRPIGLGSGQHPAPDPTQSVHESAIEKWEADPNYRPKSLAEYLERTKDPRATGRSISSRASVPAS